VQARVFHLSVSAPAADTESPVLKVTQGDTVTFVIRSDRPGEVHVHIYEKRVTLKPGGEVTLTFTATAVGLFPVHLHDPDGSMSHLAMLEVRPK
jgi:plastocyanin